MKRIESLKSDASDFVRKKLKFFQSNSFAKLTACLIITAVMCIPTYVALIFYVLLNPTGFWQLLTFLALNIFFLGGIQLAFGIFGVFMIFSILVEA